MNNRGQKTIFGFALVLVVFLALITAFATIEPLKETLDDNRGGDGLNCKGTLTFNQSAYDNDNNFTINKLTRRPTCFFTGMGMVYFIGAVIIGYFVWLGRNWGKLK